MTAPPAAEALLPALVELAAEAGRAIMNVYGGRFTVERKADCSPLTEADLAAHHVIAAGLAALTPPLPVLSEEEDDIPYEERARWRSYWLVDPLDGTREFIKRNGEFTVNIALISEHRPVLGVIHVPVSGVCYYAGAGLGAFRQAPGARAQRIHTRRWNGGRIVIAGSRSHNDPRFERFLAEFEDYEIIAMGSSLKSCLVAEGRADVYLRLGATSEWDTAAAQCVVEEAGGALTDLRLRALLYNTKDSLLNPYFIVHGNVDHDWSRYLTAVER